MTDAVCEFIRKLRISPLLWLMAAATVATGHFREIIIWYIVVLVHEMGHFAGAHSFKWRVRKVELMPFGGSVSVEEGANKPFREEAVVVVLGPLQHVWMIGLSYVLSAAGVWQEGTHQWFLYANMAVLCFNLLPIWPLDGGRVLFLVMTKWLPFHRAQKIFLLFSFSFLFLFILYMVLFPFHLNLWMICFFLLSSHFIEWKRRKYVFLRFLLDKYHKPVTHCQKVRFLVDGGAEISSVLRMLYKSRHHEIVIKESRLVSLYERDVLHAYFARGKVRCAIREIFR